MPKAGVRSVDEYIASQPEPSRGVLERVRGAIRKALPLCDEVISYQIPTYKLKDRAVLYFAGWKKHYSLYPVSKALLAAFEDEVASYEVSKGTIRFPLGERVPVKLIGRIAKSRLREVGERNAG
jgi:uncharacterized protein YdhG (YjbR/CyaY superfamily)